MARSSERLPILPFGLRNALRENWRRGRTVHKAPRCFERTCADERKEPRVANLRLLLEAAHEQETANGIGVRLVSLEEGTRKLVDRYRTRPAIEWGPAGCGESPPRFSPTAGTNDIGKASGRYDTERLGYSAPRASCTGGSSEYVEHAGSASPPSCWRRKSTNGWGGRAVVFSGCSGSGSPGTIAVDQSLVFVHRAIALKASTFRSCRTCPTGTPDSALLRRPPQVVTRSKRGCGPCAGASGR